MFKIHNYIAESFLMVFFFIGCIDEFFVVCIAANVSFCCFFVQVIHMERKG